MDRGEQVWSAHSMGGMQLVEGPVVDRADPFDPESPTTDLTRAREASFDLSGPPDPLIPAAGSGARGWLAAFGFGLRRCGAGLLLIAALAAVPAHFFNGRVNDTIVAAPALSDLAGVFGLLLLPLMWLAYFAVTALPLVISLAAVVGTALPAAAAGRLPRAGAVWGLVAYRLRPLWLWFAVIGVVAQALPLVLNAGRLGAAVATPLAVALGLLSTGVYTFAGMLGCVVLIERGQGRRRAAHLAGRASLGGLLVASASLAVLPGLVAHFAGSFGSTLTAVAAALLWCVASLITYAQARSTEGWVTSGSLYRELSAPEDELV